MTKQNSREQEALHVGLKASHLAKEAIMQKNSPHRYGRFLRYTHEGFPVYQNPNANSVQQKFIVVLPDRGAYYSDSKGRITFSPIDNFAAIGAIAIGTLGVIVAGSVGGLVGALVGAIVGQEVAKRKLTAEG